VVMSPTLSAPPAPRLGRTRALLLAILAPALSLVVVFSTPQQAAALDGAKVISGALKSPPAQIIRWTPAGRVLTLGLGLAMLAYETRDMWWPSDEINPDTPTESGNNTRDQYTANQYCSNGGQTAVMQGQNSLRVEVSFACLIKSRSGTYLPRWSFTSKSNCYNPTTGAIAVGRTAGSWGQSSVSNLTLSSSDLVINSKTGTDVTPCGTGSYPISVELIPQGGNGVDVLRYMNLTGLNGGYPKEMLNTTTTVQCKNVESDQIVGSVTASAQGGDRVPVPSCIRQYGPGHIPWEGSVSSTTAGVAGTTPQGTFSTDPDKYDEWRDCFGPTGLLCKTEVYVDGQRCTIGKDVCIIWWRIWRGEPERIECRFGPHSVGTEQCLPLKKAYGTGQTISTQHDVDVITNPDLDPDAPPAPEPNPTTPPNPNPTVPTNPEPQPPGPNPEVAPEIPESTDPDSKNCYGDAVSWNPVQWVYIPVKCALKWAFVPKTSLSTRVSTIKATLDVKAPFSWVSGIGAVPVAVGGGGGCPDWTMRVGSEDWNVVCDSSYTDAIRAARPVLFAFMAALALWPLIRSTAYAAFPIIKPQPGVLR